MARDRERNAYFTVGIPLDSETYCLLKADSRENGVSIPQLLAVRVADWYRFSAGIGLVAGMKVTHSAGEAVEHLEDMPMAGKAVQGWSPALQLQARAAAAAAAWGGDDKDD